MKLKEKLELKQLGVFLLLCIPLSWVLMRIGYQQMTSDVFVAWAYALVSFSCFLPAIAAFGSVVICKESLGKLMLFPRLQGNGMVYFFAIAVGVLVSCIGNPLLALVFPDMIAFREEATVLMWLFMLLQAVAYACLQFFVLMGEEIGWMGYLFPRLEKLWGTTLALLLTGLIRGCWHLGMLVGTEHFVREFAVLCVSNILLGGVLVLVTKASGSVIPAAVIHAITNMVPNMLAGFWKIDENLYQANYGRVYLVSLIPEVMVGVVCYIILVKRYKGHKLLGDRRANLDKA